MYQTEKSAHSKFGTKCFEKCLKCIPQWLTIIFFQSIVFFIPCPHGAGRARTALARMLKLGCEYYLERIERAQQAAQGPSPLKGHLHPHRGLH